ncbi:PEP-CTERM sorting domain-containing protein [uncultured Thiodictyon sp.]|uniref:PEP-CTERM sorting domain-containing protein n=1 Tax=uncultured Thiodictyon sp. TaxID=1846217 RepID=UPI0025F8969A|nr:PEP-CTERM sorting domain-containing protein [uncultured Thiodictyon sp.]
MITRLVLFEAFFFQRIFSEDKFMHSAPFMRLIALTAFGMASVAQANLMIDVYEYSTPGQSRWVFSGSAQYSQSAPGGKFAGDDLVLIEEWKGVGSGSDYVKTGTEGYNNERAPLISGSVTLSVTPSGGSITQGFIDGLHIDHDTTGDDFGVSLAAEDIALSADALVSWSGEAIFNIDINKLNRGTFSFLNYGEQPLPAEPGQKYGSLPLTLEVPEPGTAVLLMLGVTGLVRLTVRRRTV